MGNAYNAKLNEFDDFDHEFDSKDEALDADLNYDDDIDDYLSRMNSSVEAYDVSDRSNPKDLPGKSNRSSANRLPKDWQDFDYGEGDDSIDDWH